MNNKDAAKALFAKFYDVVNAPGSSPDNTFLSMCSPGLPQSAYSLKFLEDIGSQDPENLRLLHDFSGTVDSIPAAVGTWSNSAAKMGFTYRHIWLDNIVLPSVELTRQQKKDLKEANEFIRENGREYRQYRQEWQNVMSNLYGLRAQVPRPVDFAKQENDLLTQKKNAEDDWETLGSRTVFEKKLDIKKSIESIGYDSAKANLIRMYDDVESLFRDQSTGQNFVPTYAVPADFYKPTVGWNKFTFGETEIDKYKSHDSTKWGGNVSDPFGGLFWSVDVGGSNERHYESINSDKLSISFEFIRIRLERPWFDSFLLASQSWWWPGATQADPTFGPYKFSDGQLPPHGQWTMIPSEAIFVRNLKVDVSSSAQEIEHTLNKLNGGAYAGFWCFSVGGNYESEHGTDRFKLQKTTSGYSCDQMQILGFNCLLLPQEPNPIVSLLPKKIFFKQPTNGKTTPRKEDISFAYV